MIISPVLNEQEMALAIEVYWANKFPGNSVDRASALSHWLVIFNDCPEGFWIAEDEHTDQMVEVTSALHRPPQGCLSISMSFTYQGQGIGKSLLSTVFTLRDGCERFVVRTQRTILYQYLY